MDVIDVLIVDDNPIVRAAMSAFLDADDRVRMVGEASNGHEGSRPHAVCVPR